MKTCLVKSGLAAAAAFAVVAGATLPAFAQAGRDADRPTQREQQQKQEQKKQEQKARQGETAKSGEDVLRSEQVATAPPGGGYQPVSQLVALPDFLPGLGSLYVDPKNLPLGPYLAYDRDKKLVSTLYMVPLSAMQEKQDFADMSVTGETVDHVDIRYAAPHPGMDQAHYHVILWHVTPERAAMLK